MEDALVRFVDGADGTRIAWHTHVRGARLDELRARRAVILTNGLSTTWTFWRSILRELAGDHRVVHWDYRGHGSSESARSGDYAVATHADDLARVVEAVRADGTSTAAPIHVAFSMGVTVLLELVRDRPELVAAMALVAGGPDHPHASSAMFKVPGARSAIRAALRAAAPIISRSSPVARQLTSSRAVFPIARALGAVGANAPREEVEDFVRAVGAMDLRAYWGSLRSLMEARASDVLASIAVPVTVVAPERDLLASRADLRALANAIPNATYVDVPGTTHTLLLEAGDVVASHVRDLVTRAR